MDEQQRSGARVRLVALAILAAVLVLLIALTLASGGGDDPAGGLRLERTQQNPDGSTLLTVYLEDATDNVPETAGGRGRVRLRCFDVNGAAIVDSRHRWPLTDTDQGALDPHVHATLSEAQAGRLTRCRLDRTEGPLEGALGARG